MTGSNAGTEQLSKKDGIFLLDEKLEEIDFLNFEALGSLVWLGNTT